MDETWQVELDFGLKILKSCLEQLLYAMRSSAQKLRVITFLQDCFILAGGCMKVILAVPWSCDIFNYLTKDIGAVRQHNGVKYSYY